MRDTKTTIPPHIKTLIRLRGMISSGLKNVKDKTHYKDLTFDFGFHDQPSKMDLDTINAIRKVNSNSIYEKHGLVNIVVKQYTPKDLKGFNSPISLEYNGHYVVVIETSLTDEGEKLYKMIEEFPDILINPETYRPEQLHTAETIHEYLTADIIDLEWIPKVTTWITNPTEEIADIKTAIMLEKLCRDPIDNRYYVKKQLL